MTTPKFLHHCFAIVCVSCATPMSASGFSAEMISQNAPRQQRLSLIPSNKSVHATKLFERKESRINHTTSYETRLNCDNNGMNNATGAGNLTISHRFRTKCRHLYYKGASSFLQWTTIIAWLFTLFTISKQIEQFNSLQWVASAVSLGMRICYPLQVVTFFATPLLCIFSEGLLRALALLFLLALNIILATASIAAIILGTLVKKVICNSLPFDEWPLMALLFLSLIASWINGRILDQPIYWRNVETEPASQEELKAIRDLVKRRTRYNMKVLDAYKVHSPSQEKHFQNYQKLLHSKNHPSEPTQLFHGTSFYSARNIVANGFKIGCGGMYGGGIYFAKTPRKSMNFCSARSGNKRVMLLCDVLMGNSRIIKTAKNDLDPKKDLSMKKYRLAHWGPVFYLESTMRSYDSVSAIPSVLFPFLSVQTPEFVVYKRDQIIPRYVLVVEPPR
mmetsp:Transcript_49001/g.74057  ORF Transcript_49001/g.74057 Transcript_49001/m.74057 type:complete len:448 (+) Transcript_49001:45-1388(+)